MVLTISGSYVEEFLRSAIVSYVQGLLLPGVLTLRGYYPKGFLYVQGLFTSGGTLLRSLALILKDFSYVQWLLLPGVLTFRRFHVEGFLYPGFLTFRGYYVKGFLRSGVLTPRPDLTSRVSYVQRFLCSGDFTSIDSYVQVV